MAAEGEAVAASGYLVLENQVSELRRLLGKKTMAAEILKDALEVASGLKNRYYCCWGGIFPTIIQKMIFSTFHE